MALVIKEGGDCRGWLSSLPLREARRDWRTRSAKTSDGGGRGSASAYHGNRSRRNRDCGHKGDGWRRKNGPAKFPPNVRSRISRRMRIALSAVAFRVRNAWRIGRSIGSAGLLIAVGVAPPGIAWGVAPSFFRPAPPWITRHPAFGHLRPAPGKACVAAFSVSASRMKPVPAEERVGPSGRAGHTLCMVVIEAASAMSSAKRERLTGADTK